MKKIYFSYLAFSLVFTAQTAFAQADIIMRNATVSTATCGALFYDSGGASGPYGNNQTLTMTLCSNDPTRNHISIGFEIGRAHV